ncbi:MAG TPA: bifunctional precorrin-2 dehydrogenase/sirohydrochlorin ferrochelatase [Chitinophagales bacterium]|nr:bifunctional precorrin-2 dehydrogenase/sirohydrochlorin ferrochelatase [Chitinophagales bacterium]
MNNQNIVSENFLFPVFLKLEEMSVLLLGAGYVGVEKATAILGNSPAVKLRIVAQQVSPDMHALLAAYPQVVVEERAYNTADLEGVQVLFVAINNKDYSAVIRQQARSKQILVNVADTPDLCDFYMSSIVQKGHLKLAISTNGKSPTVAKRLKELLQDSLPNELDELIENLNAIRENLRGDFAEKVKKLNEITAPLKKGAPDN